MSEQIKKQFDEMKAKHPDAVLLFRVGDFYEAYGEDAKIAADVLGITLTKREDGFMAGFPHQSLDTYLPKLVHAGKRVAMCDQLEDPKLTKKLVKRGITEDQSSTSSVEQSTSSVEQSTPQVKHFNSPKTMEVRKIPVAHIEPSPLNPRKTFDEESIRELADNIKQHGLLQPITVRPTNSDENDPLGHFEIVCGERRYRAWKRNLVLSNASYPVEIPCIVREMSDEEALDAMITENLQRKDVDPIEEAFAFGQLHAHGKSIEEIAERFGKSKRFITERIKLDNLLPELKKMVTDDKLHIGAAMHICKLTDDEQRKFLEWCDDQDEVTKHDAVNFTDNLFMEIGRAYWSRDFEGSCKTTCEKCLFNNCNVGCLFYEMKPHNATCTNRERWNTKRHSWLLHMVEENAEVLVKYGEDLETGKTVVVAEPSQYYQERNPEYEPLLERIKEMGFKVVGKEDYFERYSSYQEEDDRLQEKLANNELYRCLVVEAGWRGTEIHVRYYEFKKEGNEKSSDEVQAMQLVNQYKENERKNATNVASKMRGLLGDMEPTELSAEPLSQKESLILMTLILRHCSYRFRNKLNVAATYSQEPQVLNFCQANPGEVHRICRDYIREELSSAGVEYNIDLQDCQYMLLQEWAKEKADEVITDMGVKLAKKQAKIEEQLTALGYNTDGTKMDF